MGVVRAYVAVSAGVPMTSFLKKGSVTGEGLPHPGCKKKTTLPNSFEVSVTEHPLVRSYDRTAYIKIMTWFLIQQSTYGPRNWLHIRKTPPFPIGVRNYWKCETRREPKIRVTYVHIWIVGSKTIFSFL